MTGALDCASTGGVATISTASTMTLTRLRHSSPCEISRMHSHSLAEPAREPSELRATVALALPMVIVQVGLTAMGTVDTLMVGHVSGNVLAAVALGNIYFFNVSIF